MAEISIGKTLSQIGHARGYASADMTKVNDSFTHGALLVVNGPGMLIASGKHSPILVMHGAMILLI